MEKIKYVSFFFTLVFQLIFIGIIFAQFVGWIYAPIPVNFFNVVPADYRAYLPSTIMLNAKIAGFCITLFPMFIKLAAFYFLIRLFQLYKRLEFFSQDNVRYIRNAGYALLLLQIVSPICDFFLGFVLTSTNPPGFRFAMISINENNIGLILTAIIIILVSWVMAEGCKLNNEQQLTI